MSNLRAKELYLNNIKANAEAVTTIGLPPVPGWRCEGSVNPHTQTPVLLGNTSEI